MGQQLVSCRSLSKYKQGKHGKCLFKRENNTLWSSWNSPSKTSEPLLNNMSWTRREIRGKIPFSLFHGNKLWKDKKRRDSNVGFSSVKQNKANLQTETPYKPNGISNCSYTLNVGKTSYFFIWLFGQNQVISLNFL